MAIFSNPEFNEALDAAMQGRQERNKRAAEAAASTAIKTEQAAAQRAARARKATFIFSFAEEVAAFAKDQAVSFNFRHQPTETVTVPKRWGRTERIERPAGPEVRGWIMVDSQRHTAQRQTSFGDTTWVEPFDGTTYYAWSDGLALGENGSLHVFRRGPDHHQGITSLPWSGTTPTQLEQTLRGGYSSLNGVLKQGYGDIFDQRALELEHLLAGFALSLTR